MFHPKTPKTQQPLKRPANIYFFHSKPLSLRQWSFPLRIISIDPAIKNLAIRVEERGQRNGNEIIQTLLFEKITLDSSDEMSGLYLSLTHYLDQHLNLFMTCHLILIERQLPINYRSVRVSQHLISYFSLLLRDSPLLPALLEIDPRLKGRQLESPPYLTDRGLKKWAVEKAQEILQERGDQKALTIIHRERKKDDLSDTVVQIEAFLQYFSKLSKNYVEAFVEPS